MDYEPTDEEITLAIRRANFLAPAPKQPASVAAMLAGLAAFCVIFVFSMFAGFPVYAYEWAMLATIATAAIAAAAHIQVLSSRNHKEFMRQLDRIREERD
jgi:membrane protein YdbS with pleckstrin-like domain